MAAATETKNGHTTNEDESDVIPGSGIRRNSAAGVALDLLHIPYPTDRPKSPGLSKLTEFQRKKVDYMFDAFFAPSDGDTVNHNDFFRLLKLATNIRQWSPLNPGFKDFQNRIASIWAGLIKGTLVYKAVSNALVMNIGRDEWQHYWGDFVEAAKLAGDKWPETSKDGRVHYQCQKDLKDFMFNCMDVNGDGVIDKEEYKLCLQAFEIPDFDIEDAYERLSRSIGMFDTPPSPSKYSATNEPVTPTTPLSPSSKLKITEDRFEKLWFEYLTSAVETEPGNYILGKPLYT
ncbi:sarcoplasmic calcium-binding proteins II, V, VI, and VII-like isoform X2 [Tubulanus polymorphus]|uniref:sarcoplasmic calcium-binding proteins II, V, VI, and VII-like isoform X2 n=1 Tax=Tubulanus polymorphus TaxID=672921 RepID=UPI003DA27DA0